jgi:DNA replication and repair protein RecF
MDLLGNLRAVLFLPQDVQMISGSPSERRRYLDITLCQIDSIYCHTLSNYNKVLEQRNALLKQITEGSSSLDVLPIFTEKLVTLGSQIFARRSKFITELARETHQVHYEALTNGRETIRLQYMPRLTNNRSRRTEELEALVSLGEWLQENQDSLGTISERFAQEINQSQEHDLLRGSTNVGPHRDDWRFLLNGRSLGSYGSRGQQRTAILALKIAEINWMSTITGDKPVLLLDEVVAELDEQRREALLQTVNAADQALLTATDPAMFTNEFIKSATTLKVENGRVTNR